MEYRKKTQPQGVLSAGCIFQNIKKSDALRLATPNYSRSAGYLIDQAGLKGKRIGKAYFSNRHANFIINQGGAKAVCVTGGMEVGASVGCGTVDHFWF